MHIDTANLNNLTQLWQRYGARSFYEEDQLQLHKNISWPNRVWADIAGSVSANSLKIAANNASEGALFPLWHAFTEEGSATPQVSIDTLVHGSRDWQLAFQHTAMVLQLADRQSTNTSNSAHKQLHIKQLSDAADVAAWVATGSKAFGYTIDEKVIMPLLSCDDMQLLLAYDEDSHPVATALLFKTGDVVGIHQIGVPADHQGKGYATQMMHFLIQSAQSWQAQYVVLQASEAGRPVYQKLGFVDQFLITYLQRVKS